MDTGTSQDDSLPFVSVVVPMRNEGRYISQCLDSLLQQSYPKERYELLLVDGMSEDSTASIVQRIIEQNPDYNIAMLKNPQRVTAPAFNLGIMQAKGQVIILVGAHSEVDRDFIHENIQCFEKTNADCVGGQYDNIGQGFMGQAIALARDATFGMGTAKFRHSNSVEEYVDTVPFPAYRREVFGRIGLFDEELVRNQDDEFNYRLNKAGLKVVFSPSIRSRYYTRTSLTGLWKHLYTSGFWKVLVARKHRRPTTLRQLAPAGFVTSLVLGGILAAVNLTIGLGLLIAVLASYSLTSWVFAFKAAKEHGWRFLLPLPSIFLVMHLSYGLGYLWGIVSFLVLHTFPKRRDDLVQR